MDLNGERVIPKPREEVWQALNDDQVLMQCIPGCEQIAWTGDNSMEATVKAKVGPVKAKFKGEVSLSDIRAPERYTISGQGKGGAAGFAKGSAHVRLHDRGDETLLQYEVHASVGGKLAQVGARLVDATARKLADDFFDALLAYFDPDAAKADEDRENAENNDAGDDDQSSGLPAAIWVAGLIGLVGLSVWYFSQLPAG